MTLNEKEPIYHRISSWIAFRRLIATPLGVYSMAGWRMIAPVDDSVKLYCDWLITLVIGRHLGVRAGRLMQFRSITMVDPYFGRTSHRVLGVALSVHNTYQWGVCVGSRVSTNQIASKLFPSVYSMISTNFEVLSRATGASYKKLIPWPG